MSRKQIRRIAVTLGAGAALGAAGLALDASGAPGPAGPPTFSHPGKIDNRYLPLTRRKRCELRGEADDGTVERSIKTVLDRRKVFMVAGQRVPAIVVEDQAFEDGELVEATLDYFAQGDNGWVYYLGEHVKNLRNGKVVNRKGTWLFGRDTDRLGVAMPAEPKLGQQWRLEDVPGTTMESNRLEETGLRTKVGKAIREDVIRVQEFIQPEGEVEYKLYASGIGTVAEYPPGGRVSFAGCR